MSDHELGVVTRELLVRHLEAWVPAALHRSRRATFAQAYGGSGDETAISTLRVFADFADLLPGRRLTVVVVTERAARLTERLRDVEREVGSPPELAVHVVPGDLERLPVALRAAGAAGAPVLAYLDASRGPAPSGPTLSAVAGGRPAELLVALGPQARTGLDHRRALHHAGFPLVADVELVAAGSSDPWLVAFATGSGKSLDAFKDAMWAVDEYAGVRYRDPRDPDRHLLDISLSPHPGPLRRELLAHLEAAGESSVADLRRFTASETVYRATDATRVLTALLAGGLITRSPERGRLSGDVRIGLAGPLSAR
jgi:hypothetical protein